MLSSGAVGGGEMLRHDLKSFEGSPADRLHKHDHEEEKIPAGLEGQFAAMLMQGFFSPVTSRGVDPDGAGGALTLGPASEANAMLMFKIESTSNYVSV